MGPVMEKAAEKRLKKGRVDAAIAGGVLPRLIVALSRRRASGTSSTSTDGTT